MNHIELSCSHSCFILFFQSEVMQLTDGSTKLKLFMDVLDGTKAAVSYDTNCFLLIVFLSLFTCSVFYLFNTVFLSNHFPFFYLFQLTTPMSVPCLRLGSMMATLLLILLKQWRRFVFTHLTNRDYRFSKCHLCTLDIF